MIYRSQVTLKGNSSYSVISQADAEANAKFLDDNGCRGCTRCTDCTDCRGDVVQAGLPNSWPCYGWLKDGRLFIHCGCRRFRFDEAMEYWDRPEKIGRREVVAAVKYIAEVAKLRGWEV